MTPSQLKKNYKQHNPDGHFFDHETMKFFGDTMQNFGCYSDGPYWILYRKQSTSKNHGHNSRWYFSKKTFKMLPVGGKLLADVISDHVNY